MPLKKASWNKLYQRPRSEACGACGTASSGGPRDHPRFHRQQTFALQLFAGELAGAPDGLRLLPHPPLGGLFVMAAKLHLAEHALALHFLLQHLEGLVDIVVTDENLHAAFLFDRAVDGPMAKGPGANGARYAHSVADGIAARSNVNIRNCARRWRLWLPIGETETSVRRRFMGRSSGQVSARLYVSHKWARRDAVARLVGIEGGVVSGVFNLESSGVRASDWRPRHDKRYHEA